MRGSCRKARGSGLIIALAVLAMMAVMATSFVTLMRLDKRITTNYVDDLRCEILARGMLNYFASVLRDDQDRQWEKYENRDTVVGFFGWHWPGNWPANVQPRLPGLYQNSIGTPISNDFWFYAPAPSWGDWGALYAHDPYHWSQTQGTFAYDYKVISRFWDASANREVDAWVCRTLNVWDDRGMVVDFRHPRAIPGADIDDDADGNPAPRTYVNGPWYSEQNSDYTLYYDSPPFITYQAGGGKYFPGQIMTRETALPGGLSWRWGAKLGIPTSAYADLNVTGNLDGADAAYLDNMGGVGLAARRALDESSDQAPYTGTVIGSGGTGSDHLGRIDWRGYSGESTFGAFPRNYNSVFWHPSQAGLEKLFFKAYYPQVTNAPRPASVTESVLVGREKARALIRQRWGSDGRPASGDDRYRVGWRRDGATYYKLPTPENPLGDDRYFGVNEVIEHDHSVYHTTTSEFARVMGNMWDERAVRPYVTMWSADTILRGKIWPAEGPPYTGQAGNWRHIDILKRVNINLVGASDPGASTYPHAAGEDTGLLNAWYSKRNRERQRLYYMLVGALKFTNTPQPERKACQFVASLADMVDRDQEETYFRSPDSTSAEWALGVEKFPVLNEISVCFARGANSANYELTSLRFELYNPAENIPWIRDAEEGFDVSNYVLKIGTHAYRLGDLKLYGYDVDLDRDLGPVGRIEADGLYANPADATRRSWRRILHIGWLKDVNGLSWPTGLTKEEIRAPIQISLWKPLYGDADTYAPPTSGRIETVLGGSTRKYVCVDDAGIVQLVRPYGGASQPAGPGGTSLSYVGLYRRWDPMNGKPYLDTHYADRQSQASGSTIVWLSGKTLTDTTLGKPNSAFNGCSFTYKRYFERNFKVVDGDLPTIGWLGELILWNAGRDGPLTWVHDNAQDLEDQRLNKWNLHFMNQLDLRAKFDLFRPFVLVAPTPHYDPYGTNASGVVEVDPKNLHVLDIFTVWDPSNDGIDNDGDGAVDEEDTGLQAGDKCGPEVRVFGRLDLNNIPLRVWWAMLPHNETLYNTSYNPARWRLETINFQTLLGRQGQREVSGDYTSQGPYETIGDCLRYDALHASPGRLWSQISEWPTYTDPRLTSYAQLGEVGISGLNLDTWAGDDDGDGIYDERYMLWTWMSNLLTTRANVFQLDLNIDLCEPPYYPGRQVPFKANRSSRSYARKQVLGIMDRSTMLRIRPDRTCDFTGRVDVRMLRFSDDLRVY